MRIIGGSFKGIKIFEAFDKNTRPLKDLVKESILNILEYSKDSKINLKNSLILDLFSGTGSFGLECISRGASKVYFFENYSQSIEILHKNIKKLKCENKARVFNQNAFKEFKGKEIQPGENCKTNEELDDFIKDHVESAYHPCGTCKMGSASDPSSVVDEECNVIGVKNLRVVDSSIFPNITNGNLNGPTIMTAEKASDHIMGKSVLPKSNYEPWINTNWETKDR